MGLMLLKLDSVPAGAGLTLVDRSSPSLERWR